MKGARAVGLGGLMLLGWGGSVAAVGVLAGRVEEGEGGFPPVVQVFRVDAATGLRTYWGAGMPDEMGRFEVTVGEGLDRPERVELEAPPFVWRAWVRPGEPAVLVLVRPGRAPARLRGVAGSTRWEGAHPEAVLDSLARLQGRLLQESAYDLTVGSGAVSGGRSLVERSRLDSVWGVYLRAWDEAWGQLRKEDVPGSWEDALWALRAGWTAVAAPTAEEQAALLTGLRGRLVQEGAGGVLRSPAALEAWSVALRAWWTRPACDAAALQRACRDGDWDAVQQAMGMPDASREELELAWWVRARQAGLQTVEPVLRYLPFQAPMAQVWDRMLASPPPGTAGFPVDDFHWTTPSGDWERRSETADTPWTLLLVVRAGSSAADVERQVFEAIRKRLDRRDWAFIVLSVDFREADWERTASQRLSNRETVRWVGADARLMEALGVVTVPQLIAIDGTGAISARVKALPSQGLEGQIQQILRSER